jgi:addiction module HigA family antidote
MRKIPYPHPGEILMHEFLEPMGITQYRLAKEIGVPQRRIGEIVAGTRAVTVDTGLRLSRYFGTSEGFWTGATRPRRRDGKDALARNWHRSNCGLGIIGHRGRRCRFNDDQDATENCIVEAVTRRQASEAS